MRPIPASAPHWNYFLALCDDVRQLGRSVELDPRNFRTFSLEILRLLLATCSEIDVVQRLFCAKLDPKAKPNNIDGYSSIVLSKYPSFESMIVDIPQHGIELTPWLGWAKGHNPDWWRAHNNVKHTRSSHFDQANLGNLLHALAGLHVLLVYYQQKGLGEVSLQHSDSQFLVLSDKNPLKRTAGVNLQKHHYRLP